MKEFLFNELKKSGLEVENSKFLIAKLRGIGI